MMSRRLDWFSPAVRCVAAWMTVGLGAAPAATARDAASLRLDPGTPVLFLTIDTLRADEMRRQDAGRDVTPFLDELGAQGFDLTRCFAQCSWTLPSMLSLFSSLEPATIGVKAGFRVRGEAKQELEREYFSDRHVTVVEVLQSQGYATRGINTNPLLSAAQGFPQGFDEYDETACLWGSADCVLQLAAESIRSRGARPLFLWVHLYDPHASGSRRDPRAQPKGGRAATLDEDGPRTTGTTRPKRRVPPVPTYPPPSGYEALFSSAPGATFADSVRLDYARKTRFMDDRLREFFQRPDLREFLDQALVIVAVDHGEEFSEKGKWGHGLSVANTLVHTPLLIRLPMRVDAGRRIDDIVRNLDVAPTVLDLLRIPAPAAFQGKSLVPLLAGGSVDIEYVYGETQLGQRDLRFLIDPAREWKLVWNRKKDRFKLYSLVRDPGEHDNVISAHADVTERMKRELAQRVEEMESHVEIETQTGEIDPALLERLEALGYIGP